MTIVEKPLNVNFIHIKNRNNIISNINICLPHLPII